MANVNKAMTDSGGGTKFNYSAPRTATRSTAPVSTAKANRDTQTRFEKEEQARLAAQAKMIAEQKAVADAVAKFQFMESQRLAAAEAERQRQAAAVAEQKRLKIERDNWEASMHDQDLSFKENQPKGNKVLASTLPPAKPNNSFWNQATTGVENFFQGLGKLPNAIPSQAQAALDVKRDSPEPFADVKKFYKDLKEADKAGEARVTRQYQELFKPLPRKSPLSSQETPSNWDRFKSNKFDNRYPAPTTDQGFYLHERAAETPKGETPWRNSPLFKPENYHPDVERWWEKALAALPMDQILLGIQAGLGAKNSGAIIDADKAQRLMEGYAAQEEEKGYTPPQNIPDKNALQYWRNASGSLMDFSQYPNPGKAAQQADTAYDQLRRNFDFETGMAENEYKSWQDRAIFPDLWETKGNPFWEGIRKTFMDYPKVDPNTALGQRMMTENLSNVKSESYYDQYKNYTAAQKGPQDLQDKANAVTQTEKMMPTLSTEEKVQMSPYNNLDDYNKFVWDNDNPNSKPSTSTKYIGGTDPQTGKYILLPMSVFMYDRSMFMDPGLMDSFFGGGHPVRNDKQGYALHNPRPPRPAQANEPLNEFVDYYLPPWITSGVFEEPVEETAPANGGSVGDGGYGYGDGGYGYGSGGSYWSPSNYYDNEYTKDRYGYFQNLAKWVI